jgi:hypothetical protein
MEQNEKIVMISGNNKEFVSRVPRTKRKLAMLSWNKKKTCHDNLEQ